MIVCITCRPAPTASASSPSCTFSAISPTATVTVSRQREPQLGARPRRSSASCTAALRPAASTTRTPPGSTAKPTPTSPQLDKFQHGMSVTLHRRPREEPGAQHLASYRCKSVRKCPLTLGDNFTAELGHNSMPVHIKIDSTAIPVCPGSSRARLLPPTSGLARCGVELGFGRKLVPGVGVRPVLELVRPNVPRWEGVHPATRRAGTRQRFLDVLPQLTHLTRPLATVTSARDGIGVLGWRPSEQQVTTSSSRLRCTRVPSGSSIVTAAVG